MLGTAVRGRSTDPEDVALLVQVLDGGEDAATGHVALDASEPVLDLFVPGRGLDRVEAP